MRTRVLRAVELAYYEAGVNVIIVSVVGSSQLHSVVIICKSRITK